MPLSRSEGGRRDRRWPRQTGLVYRLRISHIVAGLVVWAILIALGFAIADFINGAPA